MKHLLLLAFFLTAINLSAQNTDVAVNDQLVTAVQNQNAKLVKSLLEKNADPNYMKDIGDGWPKWPLVVACDLGNYEIAELLVDKGADVNVSFFWSPLYAACYKGNLEIVRLLIDHGAIMNIVSQRLQTPLMTAVAQNHEAVVDELLKHWWAKQYVFTWADAMWWAAYSGNMNMIYKLEKENYPIHMKGPDGSTILTFLFNTSEKPNPEIVKYLLSKKIIDLYSKDAKGKTALEIAQEKGFSECALLLNNNMKK